ncbi:MerR family transcriptional regulator [Cohnella caldifontis]|uniref:MerR family transcriptional regulator n=1 Tax=Cohnella caldifontis TaxID=3027471 RepID=UPI0023ECC0FC|nr:MerR family transcriptional regulator [Cohnella sp. YIM B05605]
MPEQEWSIKEFIKELKKRGMKPISDSRLRYLDEIGLVHPLRTKQNYRYYTEEHIGPVFRAIILGEKLRLSNPNILKIIEAEAGNSERKPGRFGPELLIELMDSPERRNGRRTVDDPEKLPQIEQWLVRQLLQFRNADPDGWFGKIDWERLYRDIPTDNELVSITPEKLDRALARLVPELDIEQLVENTLRVLQWEYDEQSEIREGGETFEQWLEEHAEYEFLRQLDGEIERLKLTTVSVLALAGEENMIPRLTGKLRDRLLGEAKPETEQAKERLIRKANLELRPIEQYLVSFLFYGEFDLQRVVTQLYLDPSFQSYAKEHFERIMAWADTLEARYGFGGDPAKLVRIPAEQLLDAARFVGLPDPLNR